MPETTPAQPIEMPGKYTPGDHETLIRARWEESNAFHADPERVLRGEAEPYSVVIPPPNVTGALHLGHALNNTIQDILVRAHRMKGYETLWMPGTDHAGIATQTVVDKRLLAEGRPALVDYKRMEAEGQDGRSKFIEQVYAWKDEYEQRITEQLMAMGCSCDWKRQRFTMDEVCARAVREAFFQLFKAGLVYRGKRLVNWDPVSQTALADDEVEMQEVEGIFAYLRYPLVHPTEPGNHSPVTWSELAARGWPPELLPEGATEDAKAFITVATTRPETYLGDSGVAINPKDPRAVALRGLLAELPLVGRRVPIVEDDYVVLPVALGGDENDAKAKMATGFLKVTPAHDPNDYEIGLRHGLPIINVMAPDASISDKHGWSDIGDANIFLGLSREDARKKVLDEFKARRLLETVKPHLHSVGHSYRSHAAVEPYLSDQWYVKVTDDRLRGNAQRALRPEQRSEASLKQWPESAPEGTNDATMTFHPSRYAKTYEQWHDNLRDWCISRQLWWGHRIPVWTFTFAVASQSLGSAAKTGLDLGKLAAVLGEAFDTGNASLHLGGNAQHVDPVKIIEALTTGQDPVTVHVCLRTSIPHLESTIEKLGFIRDPDVLDTWFSSALWPLSTMGWPEKADLLDAFNPTSVLCTAREIITLWVSRMVMFNRYFLGNGQSAMGNGQECPGHPPFKDVFIHAMIQDGEGRKMSKSLGNGVDPLDIIHSHGTDALRYSLAHLTTQTQDVRLPVERDEATGKNTSPRFDLGRNFCNKLWNASRFVLTMLSEHASGDGAFDPAQLTLPDRWMLSRLHAGIRACDEALSTYQFSTYAQALYDLLWRDYCDWYVEAVKPTLKTSPTQQAVLRGVLDAILRLLHPVTPFVTEVIFEKLRQIRTADIPGLSLAAPRRADLLCLAGWPEIADALSDPASEAAWARVQNLVSVVREVRAQQQVKPRQRISLHVPEAARPVLLPVIDSAREVIEFMAGVGTISHQPPTTRSVDIRCEGLDLALSDLSEGVDADAERARLMRELADKDKSIAAMEGRLNNPGYAQKAPAHLVQQTQDQLAQAKAERAALAEALERLG